MKIKNILIIVLLALAVAEAGYYFYQKQNKAVQPPISKRSVSIGVILPSAKNQAATAQGITEGLNLSAKGINATTQFGIHIDLVYSATETAMATIGFDKKLTITIGKNIHMIDGGAQPSAVFTKKIRAQYGHDPLPWSAESFDALRVIAVALSRIPDSQPIDAAGLQETISLIKSYTGEAGTIEFDKDGNGHRK